MLGAAARLVSGSPRVEERSLSGVPATVFVPARGRGPWPAIVVVPGVTRAGRRHPAFVGIGRGLAAIGIVASVVEPDGLTTGELTVDMVARLEAAASAAASAPESSADRVALFGVSGGATIALLAAAGVELADRVTAVAALAPCCDIPEAIRLVTTGSYRDGNAYVAFASGDFFRLVIARSAVAWLSEGHERDALRARLLELDDYGPDPLAYIRAWPRDGLGDEARAVVELLANEDRERFDELYAALPDRLRRAAEALSPLNAADRLDAPLELVVAREDKYIPQRDAVVFAQRCPRARLTVLDALTHAVPALSPSRALDLARLNGALVRLLATSYSRR